MCKILIVDDNFNVAKSLSDNFNHFGIRCEYAENGVIAVNKILSESVNLILLDLKLRRSGIELIQTSREIDDRIPIISSRCRKHRYRGAGHQNAEDYDYIEKRSISTSSGHSRNAMELSSEKENRELPSTTRR
jgi:DNA-binding response OmpR family regulator